MSIENCLKIFDEKQERKNAFMLSRHIQKNAGDEQGIINSNAPANYFV